MTMNGLIAKVRDACRRFAGATDGSTVVVFALAFIPLMGLVGAAVDYTQASRLKTAMQAAADTTALMVAQTAASQSAAGVQTATNNFYRGVFNNPAATGLQVTGTYDNTNGSTVLVRATATYQTSFMGIMGFRTLPLAAVSTSSFGNTRLRVALVLDNTGSMADAGKIDALKTATKNLLNQLRSAAINNGDVYVSIIPFVKDVNLGPSNYNASWIDWTAWDSANQAAPRAAAARPTTAPGTAASWIAAGRTARPAATTTPTWWRRAAPTRQITRPSNTRRARRPSWGSATIGSR